jgi:hypothetical protein
MKMFARTIRTACALAALSAFAGGAAAATYTFNTSDSPFTAPYDNHGYWSTTQTNSATNTEYAAGYTGGSAMRNFFTFHLGSLDLTNQQIVSATLNLRKNNYTGSDASETVEFFHVATAASLLNNNVGPNSSIFADLGDGASYGSVTITQAGSSTSVISVTLTGAALADIANAAGGYFSVGGTCTTCLPADSSIGRAAQSVFRNSSSLGEQQLVVQTIPAVPEPSTYAMLGIGLGALAFLRRRKAAQARND